MEIDSYLLDIKEGDEMSELLAELAENTHYYSFFGRIEKFPHLETIISGKNGINAIKIPEGHRCVVYSVGGDPSVSDLKEYCESVFRRIINAGKNIGVRVLGISDIIDSSHTDREFISRVGGYLADSAIKYGIPILNGELANLGKRVNCDCNITATAIGIINNNSAFLDGKSKGVFEENVIWYGFFDSGDELIVINSDGIGTKTEFYERLGLYERGVMDFFAMNLDDCVKIGARPRVVSGLVESSHFDEMEDVRDSAVNLGNELGILAIMQDELVGDRIKGYGPAYNISGSVVSTIDINRLKNLPVPRKGDYLLAVRGRPNPRSNGITSKREIMEKMFGSNWHTTRAGELFMEFLGEPSTIFYPVFRDLIDNEIASSVYHMSGGAFNGKLARPLAKHGLYVRIKVEEGGLFEPDWREMFLADRCLSVRDAYSKWPMGNEGFITTNQPERAIEILKQYSLEGRNVGRLEKRKDGKTGVEFKAYNGCELYFST